VPEAKPYQIPKRLVGEAYQRVKANRGAAGIDGETLAAFEKDLKGNLYKIWNRMSSGSYVPPPVRLVEIPKAHGGTRPLGIPTVADRVAQTVTKMVLEPLVEPSFHPDSFAYRPSRSALDAVETARRRCWATDWVIDLDIKAFFDSLDHELVERAVAFHTDIPWVRLYVARWLRAPVQRPDGTLEPRTKGTPQGGVLSPLLANLFLHYAFDHWMQWKFQSVQFERYADDAIVHCRSRLQAEEVLEAIRGRFEQCGLELHSVKTRIVYCKDDNRRGEHEHVAFDFLGYTFQPRRAKNRQGEFFVSFLPAISTKAAKSIPCCHPAVEDGVHQESSDPGGPGSARQSVGAGLDALLRPVLPVQVSPSPSPSQRGPRGLGATEVQTAATSKESLRALARAHLATEPDAIRAVDPRGATGGWFVRAG
jgi:RNA-directed DNA polymerase